jgi:squalene-hopene/tetraprenyl-beta-curcumene cyclase
VPALVEAGVGSDHRALRSALAWLESHQNPDGGWGEDLRSYDDPAWSGRGVSTASQTAWALLALLAIDPTRPSVERGVAFLAATQRDDGSWDEPFFTGTGFPGDFYINYHLYRLVFPVTALGRYHRAGGTGTGVDR